MGRQPVVITKAGLRQLDAYKYVSGVSTWGDNMMNPFWEYCVQLLPMWIAPNLVTFLGLLAFTLAHVVMAWYSPDLAQPLPWWVNVLAALCLFAYNTLDAIDGKQARRTKASSPLGQLFDHGCDAITATFLCMNIMSALQFGTSLRSMLLLVSVVVPFYLSQWEEYHTHQMRTNIGQFGVTEAQALAISLFLTSAIVPTGFWATPIFGLIAARDIVLLGFLGAPCFSIVDFLRNTLSKTSDIMTAAMQLSSPVFISVAAVFFSTIDVGGGLSAFQTHPRLVLLCLGLASAHVVNIVIVSSVTRMELPRVQPLSTGVMVAAASVAVLPVGLVMWTLFAVVIAVHLRFAVGVIHDISHYLGIHVFSIHRSAPDRTMAE